MVSQVCEYLINSNTTLELDPRSTEILCLEDWSGSTEILAVEDWF